MSHELAYEPGKPKEHEDERLNGYQDVFRFVSLFIKLSHVERSTAVTSASSYKMICLQLSEADRGCFK